LTENFLNRNIVRALLLATGLCVPPPAAAQEYPTRPIRWVVGFPPGGATDLTARVLAPHAAEQLRQQIIIDNRGGAHGNISADIVAKSAPDGHTLLLGTISILAINPALYPKLPFDSLRDFAPVSILVSLSNVIVAHPSLNVGSVRELITLAQSRPGRITYATSGAGSPGHLAGELLKTLAKIDLTHVPYKGGGPAITDLLSGQVNTMFATVPTAVPHVRAGKLRALGVTTAKRSIALPEVPTIAEATGFTAYEANNWYGVLVPAGTSRAIIERLNREFHAALKVPAARDRLLSQGLEPAPSTPEQFTVYLKTEMIKWGKVARDAGAKVE